MDKYWWRRKKSKKVPLCHSHENGNPVFSDSCIPSGFPLSREWRLFTDCRIHSASRSQDTARLLRCMTCPIYFHTCSPGIYWNHICIASKKAGFCRSNGTCFLLLCVVSPCMKIVYVQRQSCSVIIHQFITTSIPSYIQKSLGLMRNAEHPQRDPKLSRSDNRSRVESFAKYPYCHCERSEAIS